MVWIERIQKNHMTTQMREYKHTNPSVWGGEGCQSRHKCPRLLGGEAICQCQFTVGTNYCCGESNVIKHPARPQIVSLAKKSIKVGVITTLTRWSIKLVRRCFECRFIFPLCKSFNLSLCWIIQTYIFSVPFKRKGNIQGWLFCLWYFTSRFKIYKVFKQYQMSTEVTK